MTAKASASQKPQQELRLEGTLKGTLKPKL